MTNYNWQKNNIFFENVQSKKTSYSLNKFYIGNY